MEPTNEPCAIAKVYGLKLCESYRRQYGFNPISYMLTNIDGCSDTFFLDTSHVLPAPIRKAHEAKLSGAKEMGVWRAGRSRCEFLHVDDLAYACLFAQNIMNNSTCLMPVLATTSPFANWSRWSAALSGLTENCCSIRVNQIARRANG